MTWLMYFSRHAAQKRCATLPIHNEMIIALFIVCKKTI